ncbi:rho GTPase-activating protein 29-like isoform X1, partial [Clarias magur]
MFASGMLQQSSLGNKRSNMGITRLSSAHFFPPGSESSSQASISGLIKSDSLSSISSDPEYIMQLVNDVRKFADVLLHLKEAFNSKEHQDSLHQVVHERLGELLRVLKCVIAKHPTLNSVDILTAAGTLIAKVK